MNYRGSANIKCPYYQRETEKTMTCEGNCAKEIVQKFNNKEQKESYQRKFCYVYTNCCVIAVSNDNKYE